MKHIFLPAMMSAALIVPVMAAQPMAAAPAMAPMASEHHEKGHHHHRGHHSKMTTAEMKADCEKHMGTLKGDALMGDDKVLFDTKMAMMKVVVDNMDKFSTEKSGTTAAKRLHSMCMEKTHKMELMIKRAEKKAEKEKKKADKKAEKEKKKVDKKAHHDEMKHSTEMKKEDAKMDTKMGDMKKEEPKIDAANPAAGMASTTAPEKKY